MYNNWISLYKVFPLWMLSPARGYMFNHCKLHDYKHNSLIIYRNPLLWKGTPYYRRKSLTPLLYKQFLYYIMKSLAIERNPLLQKAIPYTYSIRYMFNVCKLHDYKHTSLTVHRNPLLWKNIPYARRKSLTPLLYKQILYYRMTSLAIEEAPLPQKELPYYRRKCLTNNNN